METTLSSHEPLLVNTVGHALGTLLFALSVFFLLRGRRFNRLSLVSASLALIWNLASLLVLGFSEHRLPGVEALVAVATSALALLPAVLLDLSLAGRFSWIVYTGYGMSAVSVALHGSEGLGVEHRAAMLATTLGFGGLTALTAVALLRSRETGRALTSRLVGAMGLFLFAVSLVHAGAGQPHATWSAELLVHHAGIPVALMVLFEDSRFVLVDAFLRVVASLLLAALFIFTAARLAWIQVPEGPFDQGILLVGASAALVAYAYLGTSLQRLLTRIVFGRQEMDAAVARLREAFAASVSEDVYLDAAGHQIAAFVRAERVGRNLEADLLPLRDKALFPMPVETVGAALRDKLAAAGVEIVVPVRLGPGETRFLLLGYRRGGRRYRSEDLQAVERLASVAAEHVERFRAAEMQRLVGQAELKALESQIQPHFLFNALNTLYGLIPKEAGGARRTVLNLADILRYALRASEALIAIDEELRTVEAYLEIEKLRLGARLRTSIEVDPAVLSTRIPVLSLQPLVENAVKHAIAAQPEGGEVRIVARAEDGGVRIAVTDTGPGFAPRPENIATRGQGVGMANVARRLKLCFGEDSRLDVLRQEGVTVVEFRVPVEVGAPR